MSDVTRQSFTIYRGKPALLRFTAVTNGSVTGYTTTFAARRTPQDADPPALSIDGAIEDAGSVSTPGIFTVTITKAQTLAMAAGRYAFSLSRTNSGQEDLLAKGQFVLELDILNAK